VALLHVEVGRIKKVGSASTRAGAAGFANYLARRDTENATQHIRYLLRAGEQKGDDLVAYREEHLPSWARDGAHFFALAERYERKNGLVARTYEVSLPRELTQQGYINLACDMGEVFFARHAYVAAVHCPKARDGEAQPHVHYMVCERINDGIERSPAQYFSRAAERGKDKAQGGARKERLWNSIRLMGKMRESIAILTNAALEREGCQVAVSAQSLKARGFDRATEIPLTDRERWALSQGRVSEKHRENLRRRREAHEQWRPFEEEDAITAWAAYRKAHGLKRGREEAKTHAADQFWAQNPEAFREQKRMEAEMSQRVETTQRRRRSLVVESRQGLDGPQVHLEAMVDTERHYGYGR